MKMYNLRENWKIVQITCNKTYSDKKNILGADIRLEVKRRHLV